MPKFIKTESLELASTPIIEYHSNDIRKELPLDVLIRILILLPVKILVRCSCVCKSWLWLIRCNPEFCTTHYFTARTRTNDGRFVYRSNGVLYKLFSITGKKTLHLVNKFKIAPQWNELSNFCHGITCIVFRTWLHRKKSILLFNPATRELVQLPLSQNLSKSTNHLLSLGIGFDSRNNDYKILAIVSENTLLLADVYSVSNGDWHSVNATSVGGYYEREVVYRVLSGKENRLLNFSSCEDSKDFLSFDIVDEVFRVIPSPLPNSKSSGYNSATLLPCTQWEACLCYKFFQDARIDIWVLNHHRIWSKHGSIRLNTSSTIKEYKYILMHGPILLVKDKELFIALIKKFGSRFEPKEGYVYDLVTKQLKPMRHKEKFLCLADYYTESLVSIKALKSSYNESILLSKEVNMMPSSGGCDHDEDEDESSYFVQEIIGRSDVRRSYMFKL